MYEECHEFIIITIWMIKKYVILFCVIDYMLICLFSHTKDFNYYLQTSFINLARILERKIKLDKLTDKFFLYLITPNAGAHDHC